MAELKFPEEKKKPWQEPAIVLERPVLVSAQDVTPDPGGRRPGRLRDTGLISPFGQSPAKNGDCGS